MCWSGISEIKGRKSSYITSLIIYCAASAVCARAQSIGVFIGFRIVQSAGSSAVLALGAGTLADIYDVSYQAYCTRHQLIVVGQVHERGTRLGIYYGVPLLGPSLGSSSLIHSSIHD
jgi:MFS family permease